MDPIELNNFCLNLVKNENLSDQFKRDILGLILKYMVECIESGISCNQNLLRVANILSA